ncbi:MAG: hypothetical protein E6Q33_09125 [Neisseriales bacterium]|nr:MAG: hypothetical protein E6Q33_09125 [Neisseriales bacterium]
MRNLLILSLVISLGACAITRETPAPVENVTAPKSLNPTPVTPPAVAAAPAATATPAKTTVSKITDEDDGVVVQNTTKNTASSPTKSTATKVAKVAAGTGAVIAGVDWLRPTNGQIVQSYTTALKGVDIAATEGQAVLAANDGKVVYSGNGLKGYGNLIIIKHQDNFLTAYSHNKINLVKEGSTVKRGQKIAEVGKTDSDKPLLHFELRKSGKPINPTPIFE